MWDLIVSVPDHCLSFYLEALSQYPVDTPEAVVKIFDGPALMNTAMIGSKKSTVTSEDIDEHRNRMLLSNATRHFDY